MKTLFLRKVERNNSWYGFEYTNLSELTQELKSRNIIIGSNCTIGDYCSLNDNCILEDNCVLGTYCEVGEGCKLGPHSYIKRPD